MDVVSATGVNSTQLEILSRMQQTAAVASAGSVDAQAAIQPASTAFAATERLSFGQVLNNAINNVDAVQHSAGAKQKAIEMGQSDDLAGAMIESQKASVAFSAMMQVRNKLTSALDEVMNTPL
ncbi:flagellar hook-basal body complex protein FliE [Pseudocitrobacter corydidari]|uniref:Flagellar hook-basal body complex protein FliE n=1 Tax=Pseudocitrobacter corydidari TaxID=2891570 RepID=A0ABY3S5R3_9ENTR|nr:flagellar hook-basal body complex protein FliE [Pseudocitrobacter corydidari]UGS41841.1 Flagellar hook-basal body complex protein FliE [Pseudocitrobacter corydidari]